MSAADHGQMVAMAIGGALVPMTSMDGVRNEKLRMLRMRRPAADPVETAVMMNDHTGKTWARSSVRLRRCVSPSAIRLLAR